VLPVVAVLAYFSPEAAAKVVTGGEARNHAMPLRVQRVWPVEQET
jgi:hypothetical protein